MQFFKKHLAIIAIILVATFIRFKTLPNLMTFTPDESYQVYYAATIIKNFHIIWIGMSSGAFGLFFGPFWIYIISPFLSFAHKDPIILGYLESLIGVLSCFLLYILGKEMFSKKVGLIASLLYACLPVIIYYDQKPYPPAIPFLSILMLLSLYMTKFKKYWWIIFAFAYGMVFHTHMSLLPYLLVAIYWLISHKTRIDKKTFAISLVVFIFMISPLIMFDYFHKGSNVGAAVEAFKLTLTGHEKPQVLYHLGNLINSFGRIWYLPANKNSTDEILWPCTFTSSATFSKALFITPLISIITLVFFIFRKFDKKNDEKKLLIISAVAILIPFIFSSLINPLEYYLLGFFPILFLATGASIESLNNKTRNISYILIVLVCLLGIHTVLTAKDNYGMETKKELIQKTDNFIKNKTFSLSEIGDCHQYEGWRYLFSVYGKTPLQSSDDQEFGWLYENELTTKSPDLKIIIKEIRSQKEVPQNYVTILNSGGFSAFVYENSQTK